LIQPLFVVPGRGIRREIPSLPGIFHLSADQELDREIDELLAAGIRSILLFGLPETKDPGGTGAFAADGPVQVAVRRLAGRSDRPLLITDVCACGYTTHGHCGIIRDRAIALPETLELLDRIALSHVEAGADLVAPSAAMDGMVGSIRQALDEAGFEDRGILSYAVKFASAFYGPFRAAAESAPAFDDRTGYQLDPASVRQALREVALDEAEGADLVMVKPGLPYLDVIRAVRDATTLPVVAYSVSGEYAMVKAAAERGWIDERRVVLESLLAFRRAGADAVISYHAKAVAGW
jgi:porphobilinogen synthase